MTGPADDYPSGFDELPPSAKLVHHVLEEADELTLQGLHEETRLPKRTIRYALGRLDEIDVLEARPRVDDPRQTWYSLER